MGGGNTNRDHGHDPKEAKENLATGDSSESLGLTGYQASETLHNQKSAGIPGSAYIPEQHNLADAHDEDEWESISPEKSPYITPPRTSRSAKASIHKCRRVGVPQRSGPSNQLNRPLRKPTMTRYWPNLNPRYLQKSRNIFSLATRNISSRHHKAGDRFPSSAGLSGFMSTLPYPTRGPRCPGTKPKVEVIPDSNGLITSNLAKEKRVREDSAPQDDSGIPGDTAGHDGLKPLKTAGGHAFTPYPVPEAPEIADNLVGERSSDIENGWTTMIESSNSPASVQNMETPPSCRERFIDGNKGLETYTSGDAKMVEVFDGKKNVPAIMLSYDLAQSIEDALSAAREYKSLCRFARDEDRLEDDMHLEVATKISRLYSELGQETDKARMMEENGESVSSQWCRVFAIDDEIKETRKVNDKLDQRRQKLDDLFKELKERRYDLWRNVEPYLDLIWIESGLFADYLDISAHPFGPYEHRAFPGYPQHTYEPGPSLKRWQSLADPLPNASAMNQAVSVNREPQKEDTIADPHAEKVKTIKNYRHTFEEATKRLQDHRKTYKAQLRKYVGDHSDRTHTELANQFGPIHIQRGQELTHNLREAEKAYRKAKCEVQEAGLSERQESEQGSYGYDNEENDKTLIQKVDRKRIQAWLDRLPAHASGPWADAFETSKSNRRDRYSNEFEALQKKYLEEISRLQEREAEEDQMSRSTTVPQATVQNAKSVSSTIFNIEESSQDDPKSKVLEDVVNLSAIGPERSKAAPKSPSTKDINCNAQTSPPKRKQDAAEDETSLPPSQSYKKPRSNSTLDSAGRAPMTVAGGFVEEHVFKQSVDPISKEWQAFRPLLSEGLLNMSRSTVAEGDYREMIDELACKNCGGFC
ncbi:hypothetical protein BCR34DRAFT_591464 [Clohesyomyces aquaticus]|uniref:Uncharacterized protein n=1 Tax=Clohesyomyces aquaticus TaxID=1231657 RepID=A0A1Y1Z0U8_9PLEO|nr:hypothetical protein BCR34DRAFT_591464 [Clohesyomyces aquaticus]